MRTKIQIFILVLLNLRYLFSSILDLETPIWTFLILTLSFGILNYKKFNVFWGSLLLLFLILTIISPTIIKDVTYILLSLFCLKELCLKKVALTNIICSFFIFAVIAIALSMGIIEERTLGKSFDASFESHDFGFGNPNTLSGFIFFLCANLYILLRKYTKLLCLLILLIAYSTYLYTGCRTFFIAEILMLLIHIYVTIYPKPNMQILSICFLPILLGINFYFFFHYDPVIDIFLSNRLSFYNSLTEGMNIKSLLFGYAIPDNLIVDNAYLYMVCCGGFFYLLLFVFLYIRAMKSYFHAQYFFLPITVPILVAGTMESCFVIFGSGSVILIWLILIKNQHETNQYNCTCL